MSKYIKSHSNYILKTKHQSTNDGNIYERDITTIGGRDQFSPGQVPIYKSGNFVITINNDVNDYAKVSDIDWKRNDEGEIWTLGHLERYDKDEKTSDDREIVIKKDYYDIRDFAYYGSCAELMRVSVNDILKNYPGELFTPSETIYVKKNDETGAHIQYTEMAAQAAFGRNGYDTKSVGIKSYYTSFETASSFTISDSCNSSFTFTNFSIIRDPLTSAETEDVKNGIPYTREIKYVTNKEGKIVNGEPVGFSLIDNPFGVNIHDNYIPDSADPLKYFANGGIDNYVAYIKESGETEWIIDDSHEYSIEIGEIIYDGIGDVVESYEYFFNASTSSVEECSTNFDIFVNAYKDTTFYSKCPINCNFPGKYVGKIKLNFIKKEYFFETTPGENNGELSFDSKSTGAEEIEGKYNDEDTKIDSFVDDKTKYYATIYMFFDANSEIKYFVDDSYFNSNLVKWRIRPNKKVIDSYFKDLDNFEKILLNRKSFPLYTATFELIDYNDYGNYTYLKQLTFPTTYGGYNLGSSSQNFEKYVNELSKIGEEYDSKYTDNLWRLMTHEAIKNFDWTFTRHYTPGEEEPFVEAGTKIQKVIRLYGREFDEIKTYIDSINDLNTVTYDNVNNLPDYFFTDKLEDEGWDVKLINPLTLSEFVNDNMSMSVDIGELFANNMYAKPNKTGKISVESAETMNYFYDSGGTKITIQRVFNQEDVEVKPYTSLNSPGGVSKRNECNELIEIYHSESKYTSPDINSEFFKRLIINSPEIWRHKGTIEGVEMILAMFGLRSKNSVFTNEKYFTNQSDRTKSCLKLTTAGRRYYSGRTLSNLYDYDIKEYTLFTTREEDEWLPEKNMFKFDWVNSTKLITYDTESYKNGEYITYQGLPISFSSSTKIVDDKEVPVRYLYPHFNSDGIYDGNPYYQMNGGWIQKKPFEFDSKNNIVLDDVKPLFTETVRNIKAVNSLQELLSNHSLADGNGDIVEVADLSGRYAVIDGFLYPLLTEYTENELSDSYSFFYATISNHSLSVGNALFVDSVTISNPYAGGYKETIDLTSDYYEDREIKIYVLKINGKYTIDIHSRDTSISTFTVFEDGKYMEGDNYTHYFRLNNIDYYNELSVLGWQQLKSDEYDYYRLSTVYDYRNGNNPHTGHMNYDNGHEYLKYFQRIFKTALDDDLFDYRDYEEDDLQYIADANNLGFKNLIDDDECNTDYDKYLREDNKCHFFGTINSKEETRNNLSCFKKRKQLSSSDEEYKLTDIFRKNIINASTSTVSINNVAYGTENGINNVDNVTDQIVNTKRTEIEFFIRGYKEYTKGWLEEVKYIDSVILPYLSQMIPSSLIWRVKYTTTKDKNIDYYEF